MAGVEAKVQRGAARDHLPGSQMALKVTLKRVHLTIDAKETGGRVGLGMEGDGPFMTTFTEEVMKCRTRAGSGEKIELGDLEVLSSEGK